MAQKTPPPGAASAVEKAERARPTDPAKPAERVDPAARVEKTAAAAEVRATERAAAVAGPAAVGAVAPSLAADRVGGIADRLRRGVITPQQAVEELIDEAVHSNLPGVPADSRLVEELRALLSSYAQNDPFLLQQVKSLAAGR
jgi:hypothetical protein